MLLLWAWLLGACKPNVAYLAQPGSMWGALHQGGCCFGWWSTCPGPRANPGLYKAAALCAKCGQLLRATGPGLQPN